MSQLKFLSELATPIQLRHLRKHLDRQIKEYNSNVNAMRNVETASGNAKETAQSAEDTAKGAKDDASAALQYAVGRYRAPVDTEADIETTYSNPDENDRVFVRGTGKVFIYQNETWEEFAELNESPINEVDNRLSAEIAEKADRTKVDRIGVHTVKQTIVNPPENFTWKTPVVVYKDDNGMVHTDFDVGNYEWVGVGVTYYVSPSGSDSNDGLTPDTPLRRIRDATAKSDVDVILLMGGKWNRTSSVISFLDTLDRSMTIKPVPGHKVTLTSAEDFTALDWTPNADYSNIWEGNISSFISVWDAKFLDGFGDYEQLEEMTSIADVDTTPGSYYYDGSTVYVKTSDEREVDEQVKVFINQQIGEVTFDNDSILYMEDIAIEGGRTLDVRGTSATAPSLFMKNCKVKYANDRLDGGIVTKGVDRAFFQNVEVAHSGNDGFNYHDNNGVVTKVLEVNCVGRHNGISSDTDNGSTMHDGGKIMRVRGKYFENKGPNVVDVNPSTESYNLGVLAFHSDWPEGNAQNADFVFNSQADDTEDVVLAWLDSCAGYGSDVSLDARDYSQVRTRGCDMETTNVEANSIIEEY